MSSDKSHFSLEVLKSSFENCLVKDDEKILIEHYIVGFEELDKFLHLMGTVFGWVGSDLQAKLEVLRQKRQRDESKHYLDIQSMIVYELSQKMIKFKSSDDSSGTRNLLRLHRALEFIVLFMDSLLKLENDEKCVHIAHECYKSTLSKHHPWIIQKAALLAMHMLPTKGGIIIKVCGENPEEQHKAVKVFEEALAAMKIVHRITDTIYRTNSVLDLP